MSHKPYYTRETHWIELQNNAEQAFLTEYKQGNYDISHPFVKVNPYLIAPLTALILFRTNQRQRATVIVHGKEPEGDIQHTFEAAFEHVLPVYGLYGGAQNKVSIQLDNGEEHLIWITTDPLSEHVKLPTSTETTSTYLNGNLMFVSPTTTAATAAYDYRGDCRWYLTPVSAFDLRKLHNGHLMIGSFRLFSLPYHLIGLMEISMCGKIYREYRLPDGYHHDIFEKENGDLLVLTSDLSTGTEEDICVLLDRQTGSIIKKWDLKMYLDPSRISGSPDWTPYGWFRNNALWYDEPRDRLLLCGRFAEVIACIDCKQDKLLWLLGDPDTWDADLVDQYFLLPESTDFEWFFEPHSCIGLPNGDIFLFDNGHYRSKRKENRKAAKDNYSRGVIYRINEHNRTVQQVWQFGKERGSDFFSPFISNVAYYEDGWYMIHSGGICWVNEEPSDLISSVVPFHDSSVRLDATTVEIQNDQIVYEMHLPASFYRARKLSLYESDEHISFGSGQMLGSLGVTPEFEAEIDGLTLTLQPVPSSFGLKIIEESDRIVLKATFEKGQLAMLVLYGENQSRHQYYISTASHSHSTMCVATYLDGNSRMIWVPISKTGLSGPYSVHLILDNIEYDLDMTINT